MCTKAVRWLVGIYGVAGEILSLEIAGSVPLLFSRAAQEKLGFHLHAKQAKIDIEDLNVWDKDLVRTSKGHFALPLLQFPYEGHPGLSQEMPRLPYATEAHIIEEKVEPNYVDIQPGDLIEKDYGLEYDKDQFYDELSGKAADDQYFASCETRRFSLSLIHI